MTFLFVKQHRGKAAAGLRRWFGRYLGERGGNIGVMVCLLIVPLLGVMGVAVESSSWYLQQRSMQNAADSAAVAAAFNGHGPLDYKLEAQSVAASYGYVNGVDNTLVNGRIGESTVCGDVNCYKITITKSVPLYLTRIVGYDSNAAGCTQFQTITVVAYAKNTAVPTSYCAVALNTAGTPLSSTSNTVNLNGCDIRSNADASCTATLNAEYIVEAGIGGGSCGNNNRLDASPALADAFAGILAANPVTDSCGGVYIGATISGSLPAGITVKCGPVQLGTDVLVGTSSVLVIENGGLDLHNQTLRTTGVGSLTIIFTGTPGGPGHSIFATGGGTLDIAAPNSGPWSGIAIYQDPAQTGVPNLQFPAVGGLNWTITGLAYFPNSGVTFRGNISQPNIASGNYCFSLVGNTLAFADGAGIYQNAVSQCAEAGLTPPQDLGVLRVALIQ